MVSFACLVIPPAAAVEAVAAVLGAWERSFA